MKKTIAFFAVVVMMAIGAYAVISCLDDKANEKKSESVGGE